MKKNIINIIKCLVFFVILFVLLLVVSYFVLPKHNSKDSGITERYIHTYGIFGEEKDTLDVIVYGDSEAFSAIIPMKLWDEYGYTSYVCGVPGQRTPETFEIVYKTLQNQNPKMILIEANVIFIPTELETPIGKLINTILPITKYHDRWKDLTGEDFFGKVEYDRTNFCKGYYYVGEVDPADDSHYMEYSEESEHIRKINKLFIKLIKWYCDSRGIELKIVSVPSCKNWDYGKHNAVAQFAKEEGIEFLDLNERKDEINIDWRTETGDVGDHVNCTGALKVTDYIGKWLSEKGVLENHKEDKKYEKWFEDLEKFRNEYGLF